MTFCLPLRFPYSSPWLTPKELGKLGFSMILYPTSLLFRVVRSIQRGLEDLKAGKPLPHKEAVDMTEYEKIVELARWAEIENRFQHGQGQ